jgi:hypothetical protein
MLDRLLILEQLKGRISLMPMQLRNKQGLLIRRDCLVDLGHLVVGLPLGLVPQVVLVHLEAQQLPQSNVQKSTERH